MRTLVLKRSRSVLGILVESSYGIPLATFDHVISICRMNLSHPYYSDASVGAPLVSVCSEE